MLLLAVPAGAQEMGDTPSVEVADQVSLDGTVTVDSAYSDGPGFIVIHADSGEGAPGPVIGHRAINDGWNYNIHVPVDAPGATPTLFAMLHSDTGEVGTYEFGEVEGADSPVAVEGNVVTPPFNVNLIRAHDQFIEDGTVAIEAVTAQQSGWLVIHEGTAEGPGAVRGAEFVEAGTTTNMTVAVQGVQTDLVWPMLHVDDNAEGEYEFGQVEGADAPVVVGGQVATMPVWTVPHMRVPDQIVVHGDSMEMMTEMAPSVTADSVLSEGPGWLVVHADADGSPGPVLGFAAVEAGLNQDVTVELEGDITPVVWPMLHVDTGEVGSYEFGEVEGADGPVTVNDSVVTFPIDAAPSITYSGSLEGSTLTVEQALIDAPGFLVVHADSGEGSPGPVIGFTPLITGLNPHVAVELDEEGLTDTVFPMLHYDTGEAGLYEFGEVEGADSPVTVNGNVVTGPLEPTSMME